MASNEAPTRARKDFKPEDSHYIGIDVGTGSARACIIDHSGELLGLAAHETGLWQPQRAHYEQSTTNIWKCICDSVRDALQIAKIDPSSIRGIGFDATCSLAVFTHDTNEPVSVTGPDFDGSVNDHNVVLWLDHRAEKETEKVNATNHSLLKYVGGKMSIEMEIPKVLWLKNNMPPELFDRCKFYDLTDALTHMATGNENRSFCSVVCKQGYVPVGVDGSVKGWQEDFMTDIGLGDLTKDNFQRLGGVDGVNGQYLSAGEQIGTLSEKAAAELGLEAGIAVGSGVIDAYSGWIGTVGAKVDMGPDELITEKPSDDQSQALTRLAVVAGTSTCHLVLSKDPIFVNGVWGPYRDSIIPDFWMAEGGQSATGELLRHVLQTHPAYSEAHSLAEAQKISVYEVMNNKLREMQKRAKAPSVSYLGRHFFVYGDFFGNRSPVADHAMKGSVIGLSSDQSLEGLALYYYGTMEFIALQTRHIITAMNDAGHVISSIFMSGSQCRNEILMELMATGCRMPVVIPRYVLAAVAHGSAMLGAKAASADKNGNTQPLWSIMNRMSKPGTMVKPTTSSRVMELLDVKYKVFLEQCERQRAFRDMVDEVTSGYDGVSTGGS